MGSHDDHQQQHQQQIDPDQYQQELPQHPQQSAQSLPSLRVLQLLPTAYQTAPPQPSYHFGGRDKRYLEGALQRLLTPPSRAESRNGRFAPSQLYQYVSAPEEEPPRPVQHVPEEVVLGKRSFNAPAQK